MSTFNETLCKATATVALERAGEHELIVRLAGESLYTLYVEERQFEPYWSGGKPRKTGTNRAVYRDDGQGSRCRSLDQAATDLARLGLDPEPLLQIALALGWEPTLVNAARATAAAAPRYPECPVFARVEWAVEDITEPEVNGVAVNWDGETAFKFLTAVESDLAQAMCEAGRAFLETEARIWAEENQVAAPVSADAEDDCDDADYGGE